MGDRYVVERMRADGLNLGGEQSGHIILSDFATTGDGLLAALQVLAVMLQRTARSARPVGRSRRCRSDCQSSGCARIDLSSPEITSVLERERQRLGDRGRLLVRASGTEPLIRVMVEADDEQLLANVLASAVQVVERIASRQAA